MTSTAMKQSVQSSFYARQQTNGFQFFECTETLFNPQLVHEFLLDNSVDKGYAEHSCYSAVEREKVLEEWAEFYGNKKHKMVVIMWDADDAVKERFKLLLPQAGWMDDVKPRAFQIGTGRFTWRTVRFCLTFFLF